VIQSYFALVLLQRRLCMSVQSVRFALPRGGNNDGLFGVPAKYPPLSTGILLSPQVICEISSLNTYPLLSQHISSRNM
jgi:hypothetical protein